MDREGRLSLPEVGPLLVSGKTLGEVQEVVQRILRTQYRDVSADLSLGSHCAPFAFTSWARWYRRAPTTSAHFRPRSTPCLPLGASPRAGRYAICATFVANQLVEEVDAYDLLLHGIRGDLKNLENGDTLLVPPVGPQVSVDGMVRRPAVYELRGETNLAEALDLAGGVLPAAALRHIEVQRLEAHEKRTMLSVNLDETSDPASGSPPARHVWSAGR